MTETARERVVKNTGVTSEMVDGAERVLGQFGISQLSKKVENREVLFEILRAAVYARGTVADDSLVRDEEEWAQYFGNCKVIVKDPEVGKQLLKIGTESVEAFSAIVDTIAQNKGLVVPLTKYPGVSLFKKKVGRSSVKGVVEESDETQQS